MSSHCYACQEDRPLDFNSFLSCSHGLCSPCLRDQVKSMVAGAQTFNCGLCRVAVTSVSKVQAISDLAAKVNKKRDVNAGLDRADPRYRYEVAAILGIRCPVAGAPLEIEYKVQWAPSGPGRRASKPSWERAPFFDDSALLEAFHRRNGLLPSSSADFDWSVKLEIAAAKKVKVDGKVHYKCAQCPYQSNRKSNVEAHEKSQHSATESSVVRIPCPFEGCNSSFGVQGAMVKHFKKYHQKSKSQ